MHDDWLVECEKLATVQLFILVGTNSRNMRSGMERNCGLKHGTVTELCKFDRDGQKLAARVLRLRLLPPMLYYLCATRWSG